jgi:hypothetical protein
MATVKPIFCKKLIGGGVLLYLQDSEGLLPPKWFNMDEKMPRIGIPVNYAVSILNDYTIKNMLNNNMFEIENIEDLIKESESRLYIAPSEEEVQVLTEKKRSDALLLTILRGGNKAKIQELFNSADKERALDIAIANAKSFSMDLIESIESIVGMALVEE